MDNLSSCSFETSDGRRREFPKTARGRALGPSPLLRVSRVLRAIYAALSCAFSQSSTSLRTMSFAKP